MPRTVPTRTLIGDPVLRGHGSEEISVAIGSEQRCRERRPRVKALFASREVEAALDLLHLTDMAWHDCYGPHELEIPSQVLDDVLLLARETPVAVPSCRSARQVRANPNETRASGHRPRPSESRQMCAFGEVGRPKPSRKGSGRR